MAKEFKQVPMQHPTRMGRDGRPFIQQINFKSVAKAKQMGYIPISIDMPIEAPPAPVKKVTPAPAQKVTPTGKITEVK